MCCYDCNTCYGISFLSSFPPLFFSYFVLFFFILIFIKTPLEERDEGGRMEVRVEYLMIGGAAELVMLCPS